MLGYEHRAHLLGSDWILLLPLPACPGMQFLMQGGHGGGPGGGAGGPGGGR